MFYGALNQKLNESKYQRKLEIRYHISPCIICIFYVKYSHKKTLCTLFISTGIRLFSMVDHHDSMFNASKPVWSALSLHSDMEFVR